MSEPKEETIAEVEETTKKRGRKKAEPKKYTNILSVMITWNGQNYLPNEEISEEIAKACGIGE